MSPKQPMTPTQWALFRERHPEPLPDALHFTCEQGTELINFEAASCDVQSANCHPQPISLEVS